MAADLISEVNRARVLLGLAPLTAAFHMSPEELAEKARNQTRNSEGQFVEEAEVKAQLPEGSEPVGSTQSAQPEQTAQAPVPPEAEPPAPVAPVRTDQGGRAPLPETDWQAAHKAARAKLPDDMAQFGMVEIDPNEIGAGILPDIEKMKGIRERAAAGSMSDNDIYLLDLYVYEGDGVSDMSAEERVAAADAAIAELEERGRIFTRNEIERGVTHRIDVAEVDGRPVPGPTVQAHLAAVLEISAALDGELDRRITNRIRALTDEELAPIIAEMEARRDAAKQEKESLDEALNEILRDAQVNQMWDEWDAIVEQGQDVGELTAPPSPDELLNRTHGYASDSTEGRVIRRMFTAMLRAAQEPHVKEKSGESSAAHWEWKRLSNSVDAISLDNVIPESVVYGLIQQQEAVGLIAEMREMGGEADFRIFVQSASTHDTVSTALDAALGTLPSEWVADIDSMDIAVGTTERGHFTQRGGANAVNLSSNDGKSLHAPLQRVAVHELSHAVEASRPHIRVMEWAMSHHRSPRDSDVLVQIYEPKEGDPPEMVFADDWWDGYSGKQYGSGSHQQPWEILTTGIEALMASSPYLRSKVAESGLDNEFRGFILALLADA